MADSHANLAYSTVATAPTPASSGTSLVVAAGEGVRFPAPPFNATVWPANTIPLPSNAEIVRVTNVTTDTLTITRTQEGTSARSIGTGDQIADTITAATLQQYTQLSGDTMSGLLQFSGTGHAGIKLNSLTTTQRNALSAANGDLIYNTTDNLVEKYENSQWVDVSKSPATKIVAPSGSGFSADYYTDGTTDNVEIQAAINALASTGGRVLIRAGTYNIAASITIAKNNVTIEGEGASSILKMINAGNVNILQLGSNSTLYTNLVVRNLYFDGNSSNQSGALSLVGWIDNNSLVNPINDVIIEDCYFYNAYSRGITNKGNRVIIKNCFFNSWATETTTHESAINNTSALGVLEISNCYFYTNTQSNSYINNNATAILLINNCHFKTPDGYTGTYIIYGSGNYETIANCYFDIGNNQAPYGFAPILIFQCKQIKGNIINHKTDPASSLIAIQPGANSIIEGNIIINAATGIFLASDYGFRSIIQGNYITAIYYAIDTHSTYNCIINNNYIQAGLNTVTGKIGIRLYASSHNNIVTNNQINCDGGGANKFVNGITEVGSGDGPSVITNNAISNNTGAAIVVNNTATIARGNQGFATENSGTAIVANGTTSIAVSHVLDYTPNIADISVTPTNNLGSASEFWISTVTSTQFTINVNTNPGSSTATFVWKIARK